MSLRLKFSENAKRDLRGISHHIAKDSHVAAKEFVTKLRQSCNRLNEFPESREVCHEIKLVDCRRIFYNSYVIYYEVAANKVIVLRVVHGSREVRNVFARES